jgi:[acyl-carrier-protein] S-malonyltransferase
MSVAFTFPGQGSQSVGMLSDLANNDHPEIRQTFGEASEALGYDLWALAQNGPEDLLNATERTQPAMLSAGVAVLRTWQAEGGPKPVALAGHSLGEYTALVAAKSISFADAVRLVAERGRLMQAAVPQGQGAMAAILGLNDASVEALCAEASNEKIVTAANYNAPGQVVIAGHSEAVERAIELASARGASRAILLPVSVPVHCPLMEATADPLSKLLEELKIRAPSIPVFHNIDAQPHDDRSGLTEALCRHISQPVRWVQCVRAMADQGATLFIEMGPGRVLTGLMRRIDRDLKAQAVFDSGSLSKALAAVEND